MKLKEVKDIRGNRKLQAKGTVSTIANENARPSDGWRKSKRARMRGDEFRGTPESSNTLIFKSYLKTRILL